MLNICLYLSIRVLFNTNFTTFTLQSVVGKDKYNALMAVENEASLMFVIDTSGSMGQAIIAAKNIVKAVARIPRKGKTDYILSPFKDPGNFHLEFFNLPEP